jgi:hypothetical protein
MTARSNRLWGDPDTLLTRTSASAMVRRPAALIWSSGYPEPLAHPCRAR